LDCGNGIRIKDTQGEHDPKIKQENSARNTANALAHSDPNNRKKTQIIEAELRQRRTEHYPEDQQNSDDLGYHFDRFAKSGAKSKSCLRIHGNAWIKRNGPTPIRAIAS